MDNFTPWPWSIWADTNGRMAVGPSSNYTVAQMMQTPHEGLAANAYLISAAPDLLAALRAVKLELHYCSQQLVSEGWSVGSTVKKALNDAESAIAKATGEAAKQGGSMQVNNKQSLNTQLADAVAEFAARQDRLTETRRLLSVAQNNETDALNRVNEAQKQFDELVALVKKEALRGTEWKRPVGVPVEQGGQQ